MPLRVVPYSFDSARYLSKNLRRADAEELDLVGLNSHEACNLALLDALSDGHTGFAWSVYSDDTHRHAGMFGYHRRGHACYSLWTELSRTEARQVLQETKAWTRALVSHSGAPRLGNCVAAANRKAVKWLELSGAFDLFKEKAFTSRGKLVYPFCTRSLAELEGAIS